MTFLHIISSTFSLTGIPLLQELKILHLHIDCLLRETSWLSNEHSLSFVNVFDHGFDYPVDFFFPYRRENCTEHDRE